MSLTVTEAQAVNDLLDFIATPDASDQQAERAGHAAAVLADHAHKKIWAGLTMVEVQRDVWPFIVRHLRRAHYSHEVCQAFDEGREEDVQEFLDAWAGA